MTTATLSSRHPADHGSSHKLQIILRAPGWILATLLSARGFAAKLQSADQLLRQSNFFEESQPERAAALRQAAANQIR
jgi:hypothetical protein